MPVRKGYAHQVAGLAEATENPAFATGVGLLLHGFQQQYDARYSVPASNESSRGMWLRMKEWFQGNF
jgi:cell division protein FtsA